MMIALSGDLVRNDGIQESTVIIEDGIIKEVADGKDSNAAPQVIEGTIYPGLVDMHTHLGDHMARGFLPPDLREVVLPGGIKHGFLRTSSDDQKILSVRRSLNEIKPGVTRIFDYREGGLEGIRILGEATDVNSPVINILARPGSEEHLEEILLRSAGLGMPSLESCSLELREITRKGGKLFSFHASELFREPIEKILELDPDLLIHMISATDRDLKDLADSNIPVALCPRSNLAYSLPMALQRMQKADIPLALGTDNSISTRQDMFREMEAAWFLLRRNGMEGNEASRSVFAMAIGETLARCGFWNNSDHHAMWWQNGWPSKGDPAHLFVSGKESTGDPFSDLVRFTGQGDVIFTGPRQSLNK
jgi:cytosine/adenosine deaminase-related metal-dependent hydrolase